VSESRGLIRHLCAIASFAFLASLYSDVQADTLRVGRTTLPASLGNPFTSAGRPSSALWTALYDALTQISRDGRVLPALAQSWELRSPTTWRFTLKPGLTFHNGEPVNASTVVKTFRFLSSSRARQFFVAAELKNVQSIDRIDDWTLEFETIEPDPILPRRLSLVFIVAPEMLVPERVDELSLFPAGTGPFKLDNWGRSSGRARFTAFSASWRKPQVDALEMIPLEDAPARLQALLSDQVDIIEGFSPDDTELLDEVLYTYISMPTAQVSSIAFRNVGNPDSPLQDKRVRQALNFSVDRQQIAAVLGGPKIEAASQGTVVGVVGFNPDLKPYPYDPERARTLLLEAGYPNGFPLDVDVITGYVASDALIYQKVAQDLATVGVDVRLNETPFVTWLSRLMTNDWGETDAFSIVWNSALFYDSIRILETFSCARTVPFFCKPSFMGGYNSALMEMNPDVRERKLQSLMIEFYDMAPALLLTTISHDYAMHTRVKGFGALPIGIAYERISLGP
jgi:peptide/nickel transport system substrate-binding protein